MDYTSLVLGAVLGAVCTFLGSIGLFLIQQWSVRKKEKKIASKLLKTEISYILNYINVLFMPSLTNFRKNGNL